MKKTFTALTLLLFTVTAFAQNNIHLSPNGGKVCYPTQVSVSVNGNSFHPVSYLWSTGATTSTITITSSGTYSVIILGTVGNSNNMVARVRSATFDVLPEPTVTQLTPLWVCKGDTVMLEAVAGYDNYVWSDGSTGASYMKVMNNIGTPGTPALDTLSVSYVASQNSGCSAASNPVMLRSIRKPNGVGRFYEGKMDIQITDSIPAGLVLEYLYPVTYLMQFTDLSDPSIMIEWVGTPGNRKAPANILEQGKTYSVETTPFINNVMYCEGAPSTIGIAAGSPRLAFGFTEEEGLQTFRVYDVHGRLLLEKQAEQFNKEWLGNITPQMLIIHREGKTSEITKMQLIR